jgi:hypothetical protein
MSMGAKTPEILMGSAGKAERILAEPVRRDQEATLEGWLLTIPGQHPLWDKYMIALIHLHPIEGCRPPHKIYPEAEHEIMVIALDPKHKPRHDDTKTLMPLLPLNYRIQFHGLSDEQAIKVLKEIAHGFINGENFVEPVPVISGPSCQDIFEAMFHRARARA